MNKKLKMIALLMLSAMTAWAQGPNNSGTYYQPADGNKGKELKTALFKIISKHTQLSYKEVWTAYLSTDVREDGYIWDIYSSETKYEPGGKQQGVNYKGEGDSYNREHTMPKSWFYDGYPMYTDIFHLMPSDGYVNGRRSNFPYGENNGDIFTSKNGFSKLGKCTTEGGSGTVFEPNDEYKGDLARNYFYMATAYEDKISEWKSKDGNGIEIFAGNSYPCYLDWQLDMLLRWAKNDPVSKKEVDRNIAVYQVQKNRNPYIDYPGLEQYVWGGMKLETFDYDDYKPVSSWTTYSGKSLDGTNPDNPNPNDPSTDEPVVTDPEVTPSEGRHIYRKITSQSELVSGEKYLIVGEKKSGALGDWETSYFKSAAVTINETSHTISTATGSGLPHEVTLLSTNDGNWTLYDVNTSKYIYQVSDKKTALIDKATSSVGLTWKISISNGNAVITNVNNNTFKFQFNATNPRFTTYSSNQSPVSLYKLSSGFSSGVNKIDNLDTEEDGIWLNVYSIDGRLLKEKVRYEDAFDGLPKGIYIVNHRKVIIK